MKNNIKLISAVMMLLAFFACEKKDSTPYFGNGNAPVLKSSVSTVAPTPADSLTNAIAFTWTNPTYATDSSSEKYIIQMDSSGRNFSKAVSFTVSGSLTDTFTAKQLNTVLLGFGFAFNVSYPVDVRIISSYANNNQQLTSNTLTLQMTPYKIPPKVPVPANLYIVGDALSTAPGSAWSNPVDTPYQKMTQIDSVTFGGIFNITGGNSYLLLPVNGDWTHKYAVADKSVSGLSGGGSFGADLSDNFPAPTASGWYQIIVNFQTGIFTVTPYSGATVPLAIVPSPSTLQTGLWIIGDATPENPSWTNDPVSLSAQKFTQVSNAEYKITIALNNSGSYLFLPAAGDWGNKYGGASATSGAILFDGSVPGSNTPAPSASGNYQIDVNFLTGNYTVTPQ